MTRFSRGQKGRLSGLTAERDLSVRIAFDGPGLTLDVSCFGVDAQGKLSDDRYFAFFNQLRTPHGEILFDPARGGGFFSSAPAADFDFLEKLDQLGGRFLDNANFFSVEDPARIGDEELYDLLMAEYPDWVRQAAIRGLLR